MSSSLPSSVAILSPIQTAYATPASSDLATLQTPQTSLSMQRTSTAAWSLIVLLPAHTDPSVQFFCAHTVYTNVMRGELSSLPRGPLLQQLARRDVLSSKPSPLSSRIHPNDVLAAAALVFLVAWLPSELLPDEDVVMPVPPLIALLYQQGNALATASPLS
ncbi:hypothetical protein C8J57DRAFT_1673781 [Mycena rebaudengoi]|nr:hypothetical protein C8J57DRAFT_1673781 [Mycena rebaudengoi]